MRLAPGVRLGRYEVISPLGGGGMGEVYRARDAQLDRDVAIKVLPQTVAVDPERLARFEREARAVAALSHPNILAIHDFGRTGEITYAVTELLEGESLRDVLNGGRVSIRRALDYAVQIAQGLASAHDKGIVHRDLKPDNIFITRDGRAKILDFGLAKQDAAVTAQSGMLTQASPMPTEPGTVLGTVGYMAPEQVRGAEVDARTDIFSFGAVLYEMVTGRRAFQHDTAAETMSAILRDDPPDYPADLSVPAPVERVIAHCLEKRAESRFQSARDLAFALDSLSSPPSSVVPAVGETETRPRARLVLALAVATVAVGLAFVAGSRIGRGSPPAAPGEPPQFRQLTFEDTVINTARFAPDGRTVVYTSSQPAGARILLTRLEFPGASPLPLPNAALFAVSADAELLAGIDAKPRTVGLVPESTLVRVPLLGGAPRVVLEHVTFADWVPSDGTIAVVRVVGSEQRLEFPIGHVVFHTQGEIGWPRVSPNGDRLAFLHWPVKRDDRGTVMVVDRLGQVRAISRTWEGVQGLAWNATGDQVWYTAATNGLQYQLWGADAAATTPAERPIYRGPAAVILQDIARDGKALVTRYDFRTIVQGVLNRQSVAHDVSWLGGSFARDISRDGRRVLLTYNGQGSSANYEVYVRGWQDIDAAHVGEGQAQQFSPDGSSVLAIVHGPPSRLVIYPIGAGNGRNLSTGEVVVTQARWLSDSQLLVIGAEPSKGVRAYVAEINGSVPRAISPEGISYEPEQVALSHDGTRVALRSPDGPVMVYSTTTGGSVAAAGLAADEIPIGWTADDRALLIRSSESAPRLIAVDQSSGRRTVTKDVSACDSRSGIPFQIYLTPDAGTYVCNVAIRQMTVFLAEGLARAF